MRALWSIAVGFVLAVCGAVVGWVAIGPLAAILLYIFCGMLGVVASVAVAAFCLRDRVSGSSDGEEPAQAGTAPAGIIGQNSRSW